MNHGTNPIPLDKRDFSYLRTFKPAYGTTKAIPDELSVDAGFPIPDQNKPNKIFNLPAQPFGCTNYSTCGVCGDEDGVQYNPGFQEALTGANAKGGYDIRESLLTAVKVGVQALNETTDGAAKHRRAAVFRVGQNPDFFDGIRTVLADNKRPLSVGSPWFGEWERNRTKIKIAPDFEFDPAHPERYAWHNYEITKATAYDTKGKKLRNGEIFLAAKPWQGDTVYDKGFIYLDRATVNKIFAIPGSGIFTVAKYFNGEVETVGEKYYFAKNLTYKQTSPDVQALQRTLISFGYPIKDAPTQYFGLQTKTALAAFQSDHGINDDGSNFGSITRSTMNALLNQAQSLVGSDKTLIQMITDMILKILKDLFTFLFTRKTAPVAQAPENLPAPEPIASTTPHVIVEPLPEPVPASVPLPPTHRELLYKAAAESLGKAMKLDKSVPNLYGCASSLSGVLKAAGVHGLPSMGIAGTASLNAWLASNKAFQRVVQPQPGDIIISPSPVSPQENQLAHGHTGIVANHGICSNDSDTGLWREEWSLTKWLDYYGTYGRLPVIYYRWIGA